MRYRPLSIVKTIADIPIDDIEDVIKEGTFGVVLRAYEVLNEFYSIAFADKGTYAFSAEFENCLEFVPTAHIKTIELENNSFEDIKNEFCIKATMTQA